MAQFNRKDLSDNDDDQAAGFRDSLSRSAVSSLRTFTRLAEGLQHPLAGLVLFSFLVEGMFYRCLDKPLIDHALQIWILIFMMAIFLVTVVILGVLTYLRPDGLMLTGQTFHMTTQGKHKKTMDVARSNHKDLREKKEVRSTGPPLHDRRAS